MKARTLIPLVIGLGVGFFAIKMGIDMVKKARGAPPDMNQVLVSARPDEVATRITESMIRSKSIAAALVPGDAFTEVEALVGRVTGMSIAAGVPITKGMLAPPGSEPGLRAKIPAGYRAVSVSVNEESAVAGFIMPGSHVDVLVAIRECKNVTSKLVLSGVEVGAVGQSLSEVGPDGKTVRMTKSVTLFLKPEQVQILHANIGRGKIRLALHGNSHDPRGGFWSGLLKSGKAPIQKCEVPRPKKPVVAVPRGHVVEVVRGKEHEWLVFDGFGVCRRYTGDEGPSSLPPELRGRRSGDSVDSSEKESIE